MTIPAKQINCITCNKRSSCFNELNEADHRFIEQNRLEISYKKGEVICKQGSFASNIMFIYQGMVKTYIEAPNKNHVVLNILPKGHMIGLPSLFTNYVFQNSASALEDTIICSVDIRVFEEYTKSNGQFASEIIKLLNRCTINNYERFISIGNKNLNGRFASAIIMLVEHVYFSNKFNMSLSRTELAELTAMSPESVTRIISTFNKEKIIKVSGKSYEILNMNLLKKISDNG